MTIDYSTPKRKKLKKDYKDTPIEDRFFPIERTIDRYLKPLDPANSCLPLIKVRSEVFYQISGAYRLIYEYYCLEECMQEAFGYLYLYAASIMKAYELRSDEGGASRSNDISTKVGIESSKCAKYIQVLLDLGILQKETPLTEKPGRKTIYAIKDQFFRFWYRFIPRNMTAITSGRITKVYDKAVKGHLHEHMGLTFEEICKEYLLYYADDLPITLSDIGQWWGSDKTTRKEVQIDIVGKSADNNEYIIGSCKYRNEKIGVDELELIKYYASVFGKGSKYHYYIFSLGGFTKELLECKKRGEVRLLTLDELY